MGVALYSGRYVRRSGVQELSMRTLHVELIEGPAAPVDIDGESPGTLPCTFRVLPAALELLAVDLRRL